MSASGPPPLMKWVNYAWRQLTLWLKHHTDRLTQQRCSETMGAVNAFSQGRAAVINLHSLAWDKKLINWKTACWRGWAGRPRWHSMGDMHVLAKTHVNLLAHFNHECLPLTIEFYSLKTWKVWNRGTFLPVPTAELVSYLWSASLPKQDLDQKSILSVGWDHHFLDVRVCHSFVPTGGFGFLLNEQKTN